MIPCLFVAHSASAASVHLTAQTLPSSGTASETTVTLTGSGFASGQTGGNITVSLEKACGTTAGAYTTMARSYLPVYGAVAEVTFVLPWDAPTGSYFVQLTGPGFTSSNCSQVSVANPDPQWRSCSSGGSIGVLAGNKATASKAVTAYVPDGYWGGGSTGIRVVPIEGSGKASSIATPETVNSCASNSFTGQSICTTNDIYYYVLSGTAITNAVPDSDVFFPSGSCDLCGAAIDPLTNQGLLAATNVFGGTTDFGTIAGALDQVDLNANGAFSSGIQLINAPTQLFWDPYRLFVISSSSFDLVQPQYGSEITNSSLAGFNSPAEDCATDIIAGSQNNGGLKLLLADLTQVSFTSVFHFSLATWSAPNNTYTLPEFAQPSFSGNFGVVVAPGYPYHAGLLAGGQMAGAIQLPAKSGFGTPAPVDYVAFVMPDDPDGHAFNTEFDPPPVTAYVSPNNNKPYGLVADWGSGSPRYVAVIDLAAALAAPRSGAHTIAASYNLLQHGVVRYIATF